MEIIETGSSLKSSNQWEKLANQVLSHFNYNYPCDIDIYDICWKYGIQIKSMNEHIYDYFEIPDDMKAFSIEKTEGRRGIIFIRPELDPVEKKILLAEEFCHIYAHCMKQISVKIHTLNKSENQAKRMAAYLLMPQKFLNEVFRSVAEQAVLVEEIADYFLVTKEFAQYRLELMFRDRVNSIAMINGQMLKKCCGKL